jgi:hypothetical protein
MAQVNQMPEIIGRSAKIGQIMAKLETLQGDELAQVAQVVTLLLLAQDVGLTLTCFHNHA